MKNTITWKCLQSGQIGRYKDSIYIYLVKTDLCLDRVESFCSKFLFPCDNKLISDNEQFTGNCSFPFGIYSFYSLKRTNNNTYEYKVCQPYLD